MRRFHVHIAVENLEQSKAFYSHLFGVPTVVQEDYAKWMLDDPPVNFAISTRGHAVGLNHLGIQVDHEADLRDFHGRLLAADPELIAEDRTDCCYARSDKYWVTDPSGIAWETFHTLANIPTFGNSHWDQEKPAESIERTGCCAPADPAQPHAVAQASTQALAPAPEGVSSCCVTIKGVVT